MAPQIAQQSSVQPTPHSTLRGLAPVEAAAIAQAQDAQISEIVERLQWRYTRDQISIVDLNRRVRGFYRQFDAARVRNFVGILVEGLVRRSIHSPALSPRM
jgi:hypothetical protein